MRVGDYHTYFVSDDDWGWAVWAHNAVCTQIVTNKTENGVETVLQIRAKFAPGSYEDRQLRRFVKAWNQVIQDSGGSMTRRKLTKLEVEQSSKWTKAMQKKYPHRFKGKGKVVGYVPDAAAGGPAVPLNNKAMALSDPVNSYLGGILKGIPVGTLYNRVTLVRSF